MKSCRRPLDRERLGKIGRLKIGNEKDNGTSRHDLVQRIERQRGICSATFRLEKQDFANEAQRVRATFLRRNKKFDPIGEEKQADLVIVANGAEREQTSDFGGELALRLTGAAEISGRANIDNQHDGELAFFRELFDERVCRAAR